MSSEKRKPTFTERNHNFLKSYEVLGRDIILRSGRNTDNQYIGMIDMTVGSVLFDELRIKHKIPVVRSRLVRDTWINPGREELMLVVRRINQYSEELTPTDRDRFISQARSICDGLIQYYSDALENNESVLTDIRADQFIFGSSGNRAPQLWLVDLDPIYNEASPYIVSESLKDVATMVNYFGWLTGEDFKPQIEKIKDIKGVEKERDEILEHIEVKDEEEFKKFPTAYLRNQLIVR